jgi:hypothetical protein
MEENKKICPLSMGLAIENIIPGAMIGKQPTRMVRIGIPCAGEKCLAWDGASKSCSIVSFFVLGSQHFCKED